VARGRIPVRRAESAGGVIFKIVDRRVYVAVIVLKGGRIYALPKGEIGPGETPEEAAIREVAEETGLTGTVLEKLATIDYWFYGPDRKERVHKFVHHFLIAYESGRTEDHDFEVEEVRWVSEYEALKLLSFANERHVLELALERIHDRYPEVMGAGAGSSEVGRQ